MPSNETSSLSPTQSCASVCVRVCVYVRQRERESEAERVRECIDPQQISCLLFLTLMTLAHLSHFSALPAFHFLGFVRLNKKKKTHTPFPLTWRLPLEIQQHVRK